MAVHDPTVELLYTWEEILMQVHICLEHEKRDPESSEKTPTQRISALWGATYNGQESGPYVQKC